MTKLESLSSEMFQPLNEDEAAMILGGAATPTYESRPTDLGGGQSQEDLVKYDSIGAAQPVAPAGDR
ncbi:MAG TPA: hypothetical protein VEX86_20225 [Longimicrobium sp.]|nr:hypothetical protein [Longimicrobium sp.]